MGCDIHVYVERMHKGAWVPVNPEPAPKHIRDDYKIHHWGKYVDENPMEELANAMLEFEDRVPSSAEQWYFPRNYPAFAQLAGVRGDEGIMQDPRGVPEDASPQVWRIIMVRILPEDADDDYDIGMYNVATPSAAARYSTERVERDGATWFRSPDDHTPSWYTLRDLTEGIVANDDEDLPVEQRVRDLQSALQEVARAYNLTDTEVRTVFWFDN